MKKIIASVGLAAVGAATLTAQNADGNKIWSISASLRGFYDDNINTRPSDEAVDTFGMEFSPAASLNFRTDQTTARLGYVYSLRYYEAIDEVDHSHDVSGRLEHRFSDRFKLMGENSFVYAQEPDIVTPSGGTLTTYFRAGNVYRNRGMIDFTAQLTREASLDVSYQNTFYDYENDLYSRSLDRVEHRMNLDGGWQIQETLIGIVGYTYGINDYTSEQLIPNTGLRGKDRSNTSHYFYGGLKRALTTQLNGSVKVGYEYTAYDFRDKDTSNPYAELNMSYNYLPGSSIQAGFRHDRNATDVIGGTSANDFVLDQESSTVYAQLSHLIAVNLTGSLLAQYQHSTFNGGVYDDAVDNFFLLGANLEYRFTKNISTELGYNFDRLDSDILDRSFSRNRVYFGVRASF